MSISSPVVEIVASVGPKPDPINLEAKKDGVTFAAKTIPIAHSEQRLKFTKLAGVSDEEVVAAIHRLNGAKPKSPVAGPPPAIGFTITLRGMHQPKSMGRTIQGASPLDALDQALAVVDHPESEPVLEWSSVEELTVLDVDRHDLPLSQRPSQTQWTAVMNCLAPKPCRWWVTHGRGLRLIYVAQDALTADELAACALVGLRRLSPDATAEIIAHTRHPAYPRPHHPNAGPVQAEVGSGGIGELGRWLGRTVGDDAIEDWLVEKGHERGKRYPHDRCPMDPQTTSHGEPVLIGENGIKCFKCEANGLVLGRGKPGSFSWAALISGGFPGRLNAAVRHFAHWEHVQHQLDEDLGLTGPIARLCYRALLKATHDRDDPRIEDAFRRGEGLARMDGYWASADLSRAHTGEGLASRLSVLPAVKYLVRDKQGEPVLHIDAERLGMFRGVDDLSRFGYPRLQTVRGMKIFHQWRSSLDPHTVRAVVMPPVLAPDSTKAYRPKYVPASRRMALADAEKIVAQSFPGIDLAYLRLIIAARGCAEGGVGQPPKIAVDGPSGSGKSATVKVAAALIGDSHLDVTWVPQLERFREAIYEASLNAGLVTCDEIIKLASARGGDVLANLNALLSYGVGATVRKLYVGHVPVRQVPAIVITDTSFPNEILCDEQLGRRFIHVHLQRKVDWQRSVEQGIDSWRTLKTGHAAAGDAIVSSVIDTYFADSGAVVFEDIARDLGYSLLNQGGNLGLDPRAELLELFHACCGSGALVARNSKWKGRGWVLIQREGTDPVSAAWRDVCDDINSAFTRSRRVGEADWAQVLGVADAVDCDISPNGASTLALRFRQGNARSPDAKYNQEILPRRSPEPPPPDPSGPSGPPEPPSPPPAPTGAGPKAADPSPPAMARLVPRQEHGPKATILDPAAAVPPIFIDLETRSASDLKRVGGRRYAADPSTKIMTTVAMDGNRVIVWTPLLDQPLPAAGLWPDGFGPAGPVETYAGEKLPSPLAAAIAAGRPLCAHNAHDFDAPVWRGQGLTEPSAWLDTLPHARAAGLPGKLDDLGLRLLGRGKDSEGEALLKMLCRPTPQGLFRPMSRKDTAIIARYNLADVLLLARIYTAVYGKAEEEVLAIDRAINDRGVAFDRDLARDLVALDRRMREEATAGLPATTGGAIHPTDLRRDKHLQTWLKAQGTVLPNLQRATIEQYLAEHSNAPPAVQAVVQARLAVNRVTTSKLEKALSAVDEDGRLRHLLVYHKAHTGRWSSCGVQLHNLPRPNDQLKDLDALMAAVSDPERFRNALPATVTPADGLSALIRTTIRAEPGKCLLIADYAGIEARGVAWCAGETRQLELFAQGGDNYCDFAQHIFGYEVTKKMKRERSVGKEAVLGCGYGMGKDKFAGRCAFRGIDLAAANTTAEAVVEAYRDQYAAIAGTKVKAGTRTWREGGLWKAVEDAALTAVRMGRHGEAGRCQFRYEAGNLVIQLPSGRELRYRNARIEQEIPSYCRSLGIPDRPKPTLVFDEPKKGRTSTYGGKLVENLVQAICRDLLVAALARCESEGLPVVMHVHDETVAEVAVNGAEDKLRQLTTVMSTPPSWAAGFPIEVEGFIAERYFKVAPEGAVTARARNGELL